MKQGLGFAAVVVGLEEVEDVVVVVGLDGVVGVGSGEDVEKLNPPFGMA